MFNRLCFILLGEQNWRKYSYLVHNGFIIFVQKTNSILVFSVTFSNIFT